MTADTPRDPAYERAKTMLARALAGDTLALDTVDVWRCTPHTLAAMVLICLPADVAKAVIAALVGTTPE